MDVAEPAGQRLFQLRRGRLEPPVAEGGELVRGALSGHQRGQEPPARRPHQIGDHAGYLQQRVLEDLLNPALVPGLVLGQPGAQPGQRPQVADRLGRDERAAQHAPLIQLAQPHAVEFVRFRPPRQVLGVPGVNQPHLQARGLGQVVPDTPVIGGALQHQPLDAELGQLGHQRRDLGVPRADLPYPLDAPARPRLVRHPGAHHPRALGHVDRRRPRDHLGGLVGHPGRLTSQPRAADPGRVLALLPGHRWPHLPSRRGYGEAARRTAQGKSRI